MNAWLPALGYLLLGAAWSAVHLELVRRTVAALQGRGRRGLAVLLTLARAALAGAVLWFAASAGAPPLLFTAAGFMAARGVLLRRAMRRLPEDRP